MSCLHWGMRLSYLLTWLESAKSGCTSMIAKARGSLKQRSAKLPQISTVHVIRALRHIVQLIKQLLILSYRMRGVIYVHIGRAIVIRVIIRGIQVKEHLRLHKRG